VHLGKILKPNFDSATMGSAELLEIAFNNNITKGINSNDKNTWLWHSMHVTIATNMQQHSMFVMASMNMHDCIQCL